MKTLINPKKTLSLLGALTILVTLSFSTIHAQSKDSLRCSRIAQDSVKKQIKGDQKRFKNMFVKACYDVSATITLVGIRTRILSTDEDMYYNFIVTVSRENPKRPFISNIFSISDKKRQELFNKPISGE